MGGEGRPPRPLIAVSAICGLNVRHRQCVRAAGTSLASGKAFVRSPIASEASCLCGLAGSFGTVSFV